MTTREFLGGEAWSTAPPAVSPTDGFRFAKCYACGESKPSGEFPRDASKARGHTSICRECDNAKSRRYYESNRQERIAKASARAAAKLAEQPGYMRCRRCAGITPSPRHWYCDLCRQARKRHQRRVREKAKSRATPKERGYDSKHQRLRKRLKATVDAGLAVCWRCGQPIRPGEPWDLGHDDKDRSRYAGPEHRGCNRATHGRKVKPSRRW